MRTAYFDCIAGASGDMMLGALVDAGLPPEELKAELAKLHLKDFHLHIDRVSKNAFSAVKVDVHVHDDALHDAAPRTWSMCSPDASRRSLLGSRPRALVRLRALW